MTTGIRLIAGVGRDGRVNHDNVMLLAAVKLAGKSLDLGEGEVDGIECEILQAVHVI